MLILTKESEMKNQKLIKATGLLGLFLFVFGILISSATTSATANSTSESLDPCNGFEIQCVSHLPERLP